jgi:hypothetical protein
VFFKAVPTPDATNPVSLPSFRLLHYDIPLLFDSVQYYFISQSIGPTELLHSSSPPHLKTLQVFLINFPKCPNFGTLQSCAPSFAL